MERYKKEIKEDDTSNFLLELRSSKLFLKKVNISEESASLIFVDGLLTIEKSMSGEYAMIKTSKGKGIVIGPVGLVSYKWQSDKLLIVKMNFGGKFKVSYEISG